VARLVIYSSGVVNHTVELAGRDVRIGRAEENDVVLADPDLVVSRFHAELRHEDGRYILLDLNSANGTWVFDHRIQRVVLDAGMVAEIGSYRLALETGTEATTALPRSRVEGPAKSTGATPAEPPVVPAAVAADIQKVAASEVSTPPDDLLH
jgi:ABC transport system ATP-binding/permease protein